MYDAVDSGIHFQHLAVNVSFFIPLRHALSDQWGIFDVVLHYVGRRGHDGWGNGLREEEGGRVIGVAEGDVAVSV